MRPTPVTRRRFIAISAAAAASCAGSLPGYRRQAATWRGVALGAATSIRIDGRSQVDAADILRSCVREIARLEAVFSLYREDSALSQLNRNAALKHPPPDLLALLSSARGVHRVTGGAFDPTVQTVWELYARHFRAGTSNAASAPAAHLLKAALERVGLGKVVAEPAELRFLRPGMAMTLNGIAQGYITDRIADLLRSYGLTNVLVNIGEIRALDGTADGQPWNVTIAGPDGSKEGGRRIGLADQAIATSATSGTSFDEAGHFGHIIDPRTGYPAPQRRQISVIAPSATLCDAYSTAFCLLPQREGLAIAGASGLQVIETGSNS